MPRYMIVGALPVNSFQDSWKVMSVMARTDWPNEIGELWKENYEKCGGLMLVIDCKTGETGICDRDGKLHIQG